MNFLQVKKLCKYLMRCLENGNIWCCFHLSCSCFVDCLSEVLTDPKRCSTNLMLDYVWANRDQKDRYTVENFDATCSILFSSYEHIMDVFIFDSLVVSIIAGILIFLWTILPTRIRTLRSVRAVIGGLLTHFSPVSYFYTPWKCQKTKG